MGVLEPTDTARDLVTAMASVVLNLATDMAVMVMAVPLQGTQLASPTQTGLPRVLELTDTARDLVTAMASVMLSLATDMAVMVMAVPLQGTQSAFPTPTGLPKVLEPTDTARDLVTAMASGMLNPATDMAVMVMAVPLQDAQSAFPTPTPTGLPRVLEPSVGTTMVKTASFLTKGLPLTATANAKSFNNCCNINSTSTFTRHEIEIQKKLH